MVAWATINLAKDANALADHSRELVEFQNREKRHRDVQKAIEADEKIAGHKPGEAISLVAVKVEQLAICKKCLDEFDQTIFSLIDYARETFDQIDWHTSALNEEELRVRLRDLQNELRCSAIPKWREVLGS